MSAPRIALAASNGEWHRAELLNAFRSLGVEPTLITLADVSIETGVGEPLRFPGFGGELPDGLFLRTIAGGTFEATTMRLGILHALVGAGVIVWNAPAAIERCVDKSMTSLLLTRAGVPTPDTFVTSSRDAAVAFVAQEARKDSPLVLKPLFGSQGEGLRLVISPDDLPEPEEVARVYYLQRFVQPGRTAWRDYRIFVCAGAPVAAMIREGENWITNVHRGGRPLRWQPPPVACDLAVRAARAVSVDYAGVDLIDDGEGGYLVLEVNSMPAWSGLQRITEFPIAEVLVRGFMRAMRSGHSALQVVGSAAP
jgi:RimK family alpha-L-glutamate ligase